MLWNIVVVSVDDSILGFVVVTSVVVSKVLIVLVVTSVVDSKVGLVLVVTSVVNSKVGLDSVVISVVELDVGKVIGFCSIEVVVSVIQVQFYFVVLSQFCG